MDRLSDSWITDDLIDFEYKKYILLSYFQSVNKKFEKVELYPSLGDLVYHYKNLMALKRSKDLLHDKFPKSIDGISHEKLELVYRKLSEDDELLGEIEDIMYFAEPLFKGSLENGKELYEHIESKCEVTPVGLVPLYSDEGYLFINQPLERELPIYKYQVKMIESPDEKLRGVHISLLFVTRKALARPMHILKNN
ncbi:MAG: hypothetical protein AAFN93_12985 [Bacteroidota bacterium]